VHPADKNGVIRAALRIFGLFFYLKIRREFRLRDAFVPGFGAFRRAYEIG
jgi:hypothetical protein